ncbi:DUF6671 family protein [Salegentibacter sp. HM20]
MIATKHKKEAVLGPLIENGLGVKSFVSTNFDTDLLGTFTGEVERKEGPVQTVRNKCLEAMKFYGCDLGVASEGSFGSHPFIPFVPVNEEFVIFIDKQNDLEIIGRVVEMDTNFANEEINSMEDLVHFADRVQFPSHGLILRNSEITTSQIVKGITDWDVLRSSYKKLVKEGNSVIVETDMRALYNPSRMKVIEKAGKKLIEKIKSRCPQCNTPGFGVTAANKGLPCKLCGIATRSTLSYIYECQKCSFTSEEKFPNGKQHEDPMYCDICNP